MVLLQDVRIIPFSAVCNLLLIISNIGQEELLNRISMGQLSEILVKGFFGILNQRNQGSNLRIADIARRFSNYDFTSLRSCVANGDKCGVSVGTLRPAADEIDMYSQDTWEDGQGILWKFQHVIHQELFKVIHFSTMMSNQRSTWNTTTPIKLDIT